MAEPSSSRERPQSLGEEIANSVSHGVGFAVAVAAAPVLVLAAVHRGDAAGIVAASIFAASVVLLYLTSTLYHAAPRNRLKHAFRVADHCAIFVLIAGTYTPITLGVLRGPWGWTLFGVIWGLCILGIVKKAIFRFRYPVISTCLYVAMGWLAIIAIKPILENVHPWGVFWIVAGGIAYTVGVAFYAADRLRYFHLAWHLCVMVGTGCHLIAVLLYSA